LIVNPTESPVTLKSSRSVTPWTRTIVWLGGPPVGAAAVQRCGSVADVTVTWCTVNAAGRRISTQPTVLPPATFVAVNDTFVEIPSETEPGLFDSVQPPDAASAWNGELRRPRITLAASVPTSPAQRPPPAAGIKRLPGPE
jgi:hypothetical protein